MSSTGKRPDKSKSEKVIEGNGAPNGPRLMQLALNDAERKEFSRRVDLKVYQNQLLAACDQSLRHYQATLREKYKLPGKYNIDVSKGLITYELAESIPAKGG